MNVTAVESTTLAMVAYDDARELLQLEFRSLAIYQYFGVPAAVHTALLRASSKGSYFNRVIRGRFRYSLASNTQVGVPIEALSSERSTIGGRTWHVL
jgi:KTSC domain